MVQFVKWKILSSLRRVFHICGFSARISSSRLCHMTEQQLRDMGLSASDVFGHQPSSAVWHVDEGKNRKG